MSGIDNILVSSVDNITIDIDGDIDNITLNLGESIYSGAPNVRTVNGRTGDIRLTASAVLQTEFESNGVYYYVFEHQLNSLHPIVNVYSNNTLVYADIFVVDENYISVTSNIDITGYEVVVQV
jgi:hypothetical protein